MMNFGVYLDIYVYAIIGILPDIILELVAFVISTNDTLMDRKRGGRVLVILVSLSRSYLYYNSIRPAKY